MDKILLLDIDGVLNTNSSRSKYGIDYINPYKVSLLNNLIGVSVVISSDWILDCWEMEVAGVASKLKAAGLKLPVIGGIDKSPILVGSFKGLRHHEVMGWVDSYPGVNWVAIDDCQIYHKQAVKTNPDIGLLPKHIRRIARLFKENS